MAVVNSHFKTLTEAERHIDRQIERATELFGSGWELTHAPDDRTFYLAFDDEGIAPHKATYEVDNLHTYVEEDAA